MIAVKVFEDQWVIYDADTGAATAIHASALRERVTNLEAEVAETDLLADEARLLAWARNTGFPQSYEGQRLDDIKRELSSARAALDAINAATGPTEPAISMEAEDGTIV